ncbi:transglutaminase domain-containing protein [Pseudofulvibacter geojedonensis]|uniref:Transglutaminase domain-containing protein n=1 Tax=Pseudofulvibacter geojedonensis TaxID=1123758 RepID=A0ABW3I4X8_9FLAO
MKIILYILFIISILQCNAQTANINHLNFKKADSIALVYKGEKLDNLPILTHNLTSNLSSDTEKFRAIYKWVCTNIENDYNLYYKNSFKRGKYKDNPNKLLEWNNGFRRTLFKTLLKKKRTICTGYAFIVKQLAELANIDCVIVNGYGKTSSTSKTDLSIPNHSWNAVKLDNKWYLCDATWASGVQNPETMNFEFHYNDGFFLSPPELFAINHLPENPKWLLTQKTPPEFVTFLNNPVLYNDAYTYLTDHVSPKKMHHEIQLNKEINFKYSLKKQILKENVKLLIDNGSSSKKITPKSVSIKNNILSFTQPFHKKGFYDVHLFLDNYIIATYTVKVQKAAI